MADAQRRCPGIGGRACGKYRSVELRDPHPVCSKCRGKECSRFSTFEICSKWSNEHWIAYNTRRKFISSSESTTSDSSKMYHEGHPSSDLADKDNNSDDGTDMSQEGSHSWPGFQEESGWERAPF